MAHDLPDFSQSPRTSRPRSWHAYDNYQAVHESGIEALFAEGVITQESTHFVETRQGPTLIRVNLRGRIFTINGSIVVLNKWLGVQYDARNRIEVMSDEYSYHAFVRAGGRRDIFRYDSCHGMETLHCHRYNCEGKQVAIQAIEPRDFMPTLSEIIREADAIAYWLANHDDSN